MTKQERDDLRFNREALVNEFGNSAVKALSPVFNFEGNNPHLWNTSNPKPLWADNPSLRDKKKTAASSSRRGNFGKLPLSIGNGGAENIDENSPCKALGVRVKKTFHDEDTGKPRLFYGIVTAHIAKHRLYKVSYEDGDEEEVTPTELEEILAIKFNDAAVRGGGGGTKKGKKRKRAKARKTHSVLEIV